LVGVSRLDPNILNSDDHSRRELQAFPRDDTKLFPKREKMSFAGKGEHGPTRTSSDGCVIPRCCSFSMWITDVAPDDRTLGKAV
jgi:hypothetical protein